MESIKKQNNTLKYIITVFFFMTLTFTCGQAFAKTGKLYLVGMGPGDPDLATVKAINLLENADIIYTFGGDMYERFGKYFKGKDVRTLNYKLFTRYNIKKSLNTGKSKGQKEASDSEQKRNDLFSEVRKAVSEGKLVLFIDSGDPLIYGPWVWVLQEFNDIDPEVVPGISSLNAGLAAVKRDGTWAPGTHSVILTTDRPNSPDNLEALSVHKCSMVIFTHKTVFRDIIRRLKTGYNQDTPVAIVFYAGYEKKERIVKGTLDTIESMVDPENLPLEHIMYVGDFLSYDFHKQGTE